MVVTLQSKRVGRYIDGPSVPGESADQLEAVPRSLKSFVLLTAEIFKGYEKNHEVPDEFWIEVVSQLGNVPEGVLRTRWAKGHPQ